MPRVASVATPQCPPSFLGLIPLHDTASADALNVTLTAVALWHLLDCFFKCLNRNLGALELFS